MGQLRANLWVHLVEQIFGVWAHTNSRACFQLRGQWFAGARGIGKEGVKKRVETSGGTEWLRRAHGLKMLYHRKWHWMPPGAGTAMLSSTCECWKKQYGNQLTKQALVRMEQLKKTLWMTGISIMHALLNVHPCPRKRRFFNYAPPFSREIQKEINFWTQKKMP